MILLQEPQTPVSSHPEPNSSIELLRWFFAGVKHLCLGRSFTPPVLNFLVTSKCDLNCRHCFSVPGISTAPGPDLTLDEIDSLRLSLGEILYLVISGGEPFLRPDLPRIVELFYGENRVRNAVILTSGQQPEQIRDSVADICQLCPGLNLAVGIALDGCAEVHDKIRGRRGAFDAAVETYRTLKRMKGDLPGLSLQICSVLMKENQHSLFELYPYIRDELRPEKISVNLVRQDPRDPEMLEVDIEAYKRFVALVRQDTFCGAMRNKYPFDSSGVITLAETLMHRMIARSVLESRPQLRCFAGTISGVVCHDGTVGPCEILEAFGNLREDGQDFKELWFSPRADAIRRRIGSGCFCTHEIDCFLPSIPFNPRLYGRMGALALEWKKAAGWKDVNS